MVVGKQSFNVESLKDLTKKEFCKLVNQRACKMTPEEVYKIFVKEKKKLK